MREGFSSMWYTRAQGVGSWLQVVFKGIYIVTKFQYRNRRNPNERNKVIELEFSNGDKQKFTLLNTYNIQTFNVKQVQTSYIIVKVREVYGTINNGFSINLWGIECKNLSLNHTSKESNGLLKAAGVNPKKIKALFNVKHEEVIGVGCRDNLINSKKFHGIKTGEGNHVTINCYSSCSLSPYLIYGNGRYTKDSALCKAAFHDRKISHTGGKVFYTYLFN